MALKDKDKIGLESIEGGASYAGNSNVNVEIEGNDIVAELVARELIGNGNKGDMDLIPPIPTTDGTYTLKVVITDGIPVFSWVA